MIDPHPECQARFKGDNGIDMAVTRIEARFPSGERRELRIVLGHPFKREGYGIAIRAELDGMETTGCPIMGADGFHTILLAIRFLRKRLEDLRESFGCRYYYPKPQGAEEMEDDEFDLAEFFEGMPGT